MKQKTLFPSPRTKLAPYAKTRIPRKIRQYLPEREKDFIGMLNECASDRPDFNGKYDRDSVTDITDILTRVLSGKTLLERAITVDNVDDFVENVRAGKNGLGTSWSHTKGKAVDGGHKRFTLYLTGKVIDPTVIDFDGTYCHDQFDSYVENDPDEEVVLKEGRPIQLLHIDVEDSQKGRWNPIEINLPVKISSDTHGNELIEFEDITRWMQ